MKLEYTASWKFNIDEKVFVEIKYWGTEWANNGKGIWDYYITIPESSVPNRFSELWLDIPNNFINAPFADFDWHGGITYYTKYGQLPGHRCVKLGCTYDHLYDDENGHCETLEDIIADATKTAHQLINYYEIRKPVLPSLN